MKAVVIGESSGASMDTIMAVYPRHKAVVEVYKGRGEVIGIGPFTDRGNMAIFRSREAAEAFVVYQEAWAKGDAKALAASYDAGAVALTAAGAVTGRTAIEQMFTANFAGPWKGTTIKLTPGKTHTLSPEIRVGEGTYEISGMVDASARALPPVHGRYMNTTINRGGIWIIADQATFAITTPAGTR